MRGSTLTKAQKVLDLMQTGIGLSVAAKMTGIDTRTLAKALKKLKVGRKKKGGKYYIVGQLNERIVENVIYYMLRGMSATRACLRAHTKPQTVARILVPVAGVNHPVMSKFGNRYRLNVVRVNKIASVFYGRIYYPEHDYFDSSGARRQTGGTVLGEQDKPDKAAYADDYVDIRWQLDFDPLTTVLRPEDVCKLMPKMMLDFLREAVEKPALIRGSQVEELAIKNIQKRAVYFSQYLGFSVEDLASMVPGDANLRMSVLDACLGLNGTELDDIIKCGTDRRGSSHEYITVADFNSMAAHTDKGEFTILFQKKGWKGGFPAKPVIINYAHDLKADMALVQGKKIRGRKRKKGNKKKNKKKKKK